MILTVDVGNTGMVFGYYEGDNLRERFCISSVPARTADEYELMLRMMCQQKQIALAEIEGSVISCVVPTLKASVEKAVTAVFGGRPLIVGHGLKTGLNIRVDNQTDVGSDIVANMVAATADYKGPVAVVDFGTATTLSAVNSAGELVGVAIMPGIRVSMAALAKSAAALSVVSLGAPKRVLGKNTEESMVSGCIYGTAAMIDGMLARLCEELNVSEIPVIACGELAEKIVPHCRAKIEMCPQLTLQGLLRIYRLNTRRKTK